MYFKLALRNVKKSFKDYLIYFLTLTFSVCLFYAFNSFQEQRAVLDMTTIQSDMMDQAAMIMLMLSWVVAVTLAFLIIYANNFLIKRRKKEFGLLMIMGMSKGNISRILCYETFMIGLVSLFTGLLAGFFLSQLLTVMTAHLFIIPLDNYRFIFSLASMLITVASFALIFLLVMIFNTISLNKYKCIDLLNADKKNEQVKIKSTLTILNLFILALVLLIGDYIFVLKMGTAMFLALPQVVLAGCLGTLFFFMSLAGFLLRFIQSRKRIYFRKLNMFVLRQVNANINTNVLSMSVICVLLLLGIGAFSTGLSLNQTINASIASSTPFDVTYESYSAEEIPFDEVAERLKLDTSVIENQFDIHNYGFYDEEKDESFTYLSLANQIPESAQAHIRLYSPMDIPVYSLSDYNLFLQAKGLSPIELKDDQAFLFGSNEVSQEEAVLIYEYIPAISLKGKELTLVKKETPIS